MISEHVLFAQTGCEPHEPSEALRSQVLLDGGHRCLLALTQRWWHNDGESPEQALELQVSHATRPGLHAPYGDLGSFFVGDF